MNMQHYTILQQLTISGRATTQLFDHGARLTRELLKNGARLTRKRLVYPQPVSR